jgi:alpha-tubulin suppressor-like RCC1 family protein
MLALPLVLQIVQLAASSYGHTCALMSDETIRCWGEDPAHVVTPPLKGVVQLGVGDAQSCALLRDHTVSCWRGDAKPEKVPGLTDAIALAAGDRISCAVRAGGTVGCWGSDGENLGDGKEAAHAGVVQAKGLDHVTAVAVGSFACARRDDGTVWCWGMNQAALPAPIAGAKDVVEIAAGNLQACLRGKDGGVRCWGFNDSGQLGRGDGTEGKEDLFKDPAPVKGVSGATAVSTSQDHACAIAAGKVWCWGAEKSNPSFPESCLKMTTHHGGGGAPAQWKYCAVPTVVAGVKDPVAVTASQGGACAATKSGEILCWSGRGPMQTIRP